MPLISYSRKGTSAVNSENVHHPKAASSVPFYKEFPSWSPCKCWNLNRQLSQDSQRWPNFDKCEWSSSLWNSEWWTAAVNLSPSPNKPEIFSPSDPAQTLAVALYSEQRVWHNYRMSCQRRRLARALIWPIILKAAWHHRTSLPEFLCEPGGNISSEILAFT